MLSLFKTGLALTLPSFLIALVGLTCANFLGRKGKRKLSEWLTGFAVAIAYVAGHRVATGAFPFDFSSPEHLVPLLGLIASFYSIVAHWMRKRFWLSFTIRTVIGTAVAVAFVYQLQTVPILGKALRCIAFGVSFAVVWSVLEALSEVQHPSLFSVNLLICAAFTSAAVFVAHTAVVSQMVAVFASVCAAPLAFYLWMGDAKFSGGMVAVSTVLIFGFIINGLFYADLPALSALLLLFSPTAGWVQNLPPLRNASPFARNALTAIVILLVAALGLGISILQLGLPSAY